MRKSFSIISGTLLSLLAALYIIQAAGCSPFSAPDRPSFQDGMPPTYSMLEAVSETPQRWWLTFDDPQLAELIEESLGENQNLRAFWARVARAQALARKAGSEKYPTLSGDAGASYQKKHTNAGTDGRSVEIENYSLGILASYEVDLWGRVRATAKSAELAATATREDLNAAAMTIAAEVARRWIGIIASQRGLLLLQQQLTTNETYLELVELRFQKSLASALDVMQQKQLVERVRAQIPLAKMQEQLLRNELAVLTGRLPHALPVLDPDRFPRMDNLPPAGVPAQLLDNRPDIRAAFHRLGAADQDLAVARADRLPALRLTGGAAYDSDELDRLFDNWIVNLAAGLAAPLLDGGRRQAEVDASASAVNEQLALYRQAVLTAVQEVEEALAREVYIREHIARTEDQLQAAKNALSEARVRYLNGLNDYLPVLTQLLSVQNLEIDLIGRKEELFFARINLFRSIGGSWTDALTPPGQNAQMKEGGKL